MEEKNKITKSNLNEDYLKNIEKIAEENLSKKAKIVNVNKTEKVFLRFFIFFKISQKINFQNFEFWEIN